MQRQTCIVLHLLTYKRAYTHTWIRHKTDGIQSSISESSTFVSDFRGEISDVTSMLISAPVLCPLVLWQDIVLCTASACHPLSPPLSMAAASWHRSSSRQLLISALLKSSGHQSSSVAATRC